MLTILNYKIAIAMKIKIENGMKISILEKVLWNHDTKNHTSIPPSTISVRKFFLWEALESGV